MAAPKQMEKEFPPEDEESKATPILIAAFVGFLLIVLFVIFRRRTSARRDFLLTGLSDSGKSTIFVQLLHKKFPSTFTSIKENVGEYHSGRLSGRLVDIPGQYRVRQKFFDQYKHTARGIIYTIDAGTITKDIRDVTDAFYSVLCDNSIQNCPILVLCNKQDVATAKSAHVIKQMLEKEINIVRETRSKKLKSVGDENAANQAVYLGKSGKEFEFSHVAQNVQFYDCSAKQNQLDNLSDWIDRML